MNDKIVQIDAYEYDEKCGNTYVGGGIMMLDEQGEEICRLNKGTIQEKKIALLWQASPQLREACEALIKACDSAPPVDLIHHIGKACELAKLAIDYAENGELK